MTESTFGALLAECDRVIAGPPSAENLKRFSALVKDPTLYLYAFNKLDNPEWIEELWSRGFFSNPPEPQTDETSNSISFPPWPESQLLSRMARFEPEIVLDVALQVPSTRNISVHLDLLRAALEMPPKLSAKWAEREIAWLEKQEKKIGGFWGKSLGSMISHLAKGKESKAALAFARNVLRVLPESVDNTRSASPFALRSEPYALFEPYEYEIILKTNIPDLVTFTGMEAFTLLCDLLEQSITVSRSTVESEVIEDYSYIWRPSIDCAQNHGLSDVLVSSVVRAAEKLIRDDRIDAPAIIKELESRRWRVFYRIALHLLRLFPEQSAALIEEHLTDSSLFGQESTRHEFGLLAEQHFGTLSKDQQEIYLKWIETGPSVTLEEYKARLQEWTDQPPTVSDYERYVSTWKRDQLAPINSSLIGKWKELYDKFVTEVGKPEPIDSSHYFASDVVEAESPKSLEELGSMTIDEIVGYLKKFGGPPDTDWATSEALGGTLTTVVASKAPEFARNAGKFATVKPVYVKALISGFRQAVENGSLISWEPVLQLCFQTVNDLQSPPRAEQGQELLAMDTEFRRRALSLLLVGFKSKPTEIPIEFRNYCWQMLRPLTDHPEPTAEYEAQYGGQNMDPAMMSLNTVRGEAMHAVVQYALWVRRQMEHTEDATQRLERGFGELPEVMEILDYHLNPTQDSALSVRAVYGQWFPWLHLLDKNWATKNVRSIFPLDPVLRDFRDAAWHTYIVFCAPYDSVFESLRDEYERAIDLIGVPAKWKQMYGGPDQRLAEHLMILYWRGQLKLGEPEGVLQHFFSKADDGLAGHAIGFVGRSLYNQKERDNIPPAIIDRLTKLWEERLTVAKKATRRSSHRNELAAFGWWFVSGTFEDDWAARQLEEVLAITPEVEADDMVVERLAKIAAAMPITAIRCLNFMVKGTRDYWRILNYQEEAREIIAKAIISGSTSGELEIKTLVEDTISRLMAQGHLGFRDLLSTV
jgi:hypothetical protein